MLGRGTAETQHVAHGTHEVGGGNKRRPHPASHPLETTTTTITITTTTTVILQETTTTSTAIHQDGNRAVADGPFSR